MNTRHITPQAQTRVHRNAFTLVEVIATAAAIGIAIALLIGAISSGLRNSRENAIRQNLFTLWVSANEYLLLHQKDEVTYTELAKPDANIKGIATLKPVAGEDYATANDGKITRNTTQLQITYKDGATPRTVTLSTTAR